MNILLAGYRGSGKSTVGGLLGKRLGWPCIDLDALIAQRQGRTIREIFAAESEAGFRRIEHEALRSVAKLKKHVIVLGGGTLENPENRPLVKKIGRVVWLRAPAVVLWSRISADPATAASRPDLTPGGGLVEVEGALEAREVNYRAAAHHVVDTMSMSAEEVADAVELWYHANDSYGD